MRTISQSTTFFVLIRLLTVSHSSITSFFGAPKPAATATGIANGSTKRAEPEPMKFDKDAWVAKLSDEQKQLLKLEIDTLHESWLAPLKDEITKPEFLELKRFLAKEAGSGKKVFPPSADVYSWYFPSLP